MRKVLLLSSVLFLSGCTLQFGYNNIDWLVHWYVDDYVDLDREQREQFDTQMDKFLAWHRDNELPRYRNQLTELQQQVKSGSVSSEQWLDHLTRVRQHWWQSRDEMAELMVPLANTLSDAQVAALFDELKDQNEESREEELAETPEQDREERFERMIERLETWYSKK